MISLRQIQKEAVEKFFKSGSLLCVLPTGTGKTVVGLEVIRRLKNIYKDKTKCLIIVPANLRSNFIDTIKKFKLKLDADIALTVQDFDRMYKEKTIIIISYNFLRNHTETVTKYYWTIVITDELHYAKNPGTKNFKALYTLRHKTRHFLGLTASPIANRPEEFFTQLVIISGDKSIFIEGMKLVKYIEIGKKDPNLMQKIINVVTRKKTKTKKGEKIPVGFKDIEKFKQLVSKWVYIPSYKKVEALGERPKVKSFQVRIELTRFETKAYLYALQKINPVDLAELKSGTITSSKLRQIKNQIMACQQTLLSPDYIYVYEEQGNDMSDNISLYRPSSKIINVGKYLKKTGEKSIVFSTFLTFGARLANHYFIQQGIRSKEYSGAIKQQERSQIIKEFEDGDLQVICLTGAGQEGLNLPSCQNVFFLNLPWHGEILRQVVGRALRITSKNPYVKMFWLMAYTSKGKETIDHWLSKIIQRKEIMRNEIFRVLQEITTANVTAQLPSYEGPGPRSKKKKIDIIAGLVYPKTGV